MSKKRVYTVISLASLLVAVFAAVVAVSATGSGFLDLGNIARGVACCVSALAAAAAVITALLAKKT